MARVMLVQPWSYHDEGVADQDLTQQWRNGPYGILVLATQLKRRGHPVLVQDLQPSLVKCKGDTAACLSRFGEAITSFRPDIIGFSFFTVHYLETKRVVEHARRHCEKIGLRPTFVGGGIHVSAEPQDSIRSFGFDYVFVGEGDLGIVQLADGASPETVPGVVTASSPSVTWGEAIGTLDDLPFPEWDLCDHGFYAAPSFGKVGFRAARSLDMLMSRGCVYKCTFCAYTALSKLRFYSAAYLVDQVDFMARRYEIDSIYLTDSTIGNHRPLLREFCERMIRRGLADRVQWFANIRPNQVNEEQLRLMWRAGCRFLLYGFESDSQRVLDRMDKGCRVEANRYAAELHNRLGFPYHASILLGFPGETEEDILKTLAFLREMRPPKTGINWYVPLPGSPDYDTLRSQGKISTDDPMEWRRIGEVNESRVYADVEPERFRELYDYAQRLAARLSKGWPWFVEHAIRGELEPPARQGIEIPLAGESRIAAPDDLRVIQPSVRPAHVGTEPKAVAQGSVSAVGVSSDDWRSFGRLTRDKWRELPSTRQERTTSEQMLQWPDRELLQYWEECRQSTREVRGWYQQLYAPALEGSDLADIGPGIGLDGIHFAERGSRVTFVDIVKDNLKLLERICSLKGIRAEYYFIDDFFDYHFPKKFDVFTFIGSLHNAPFAFSQKQAEALHPFLKGGGKVLMLAYPKERYVRSGAGDFSEFGRRTDGERTPWCEWYDDEKVQALFGPCYFLNWSKDFGTEGIEFNWFDLTKLREE